MRGGAWLRDGRGDEGGREENAGWCREAFMEAGGGLGQGREEGGGEGIFE